MLNDDYPAFDQVIITGRVSMIAAHETTFHFSFRFFSCV